MFNTDATVRFGQILSARTLRYGKFNEYIIIINILPAPVCQMLSEENAQVPA